MSLFPAVTKRLILCTVLVFLAGCVRKSELTKAQSEVVELQAKVRLLETQRVPRTDLDAAQATADAARRSLDQVQQELKRTRDQLVESQEEVALAERRLSLQSISGPAAVFPPSLVKGSYKLMEDTILYSPDAQLNFGNGVTISSPTGMMMSDRERGIVAGDLIVETPSETMRAANALTEASNGKVEVTADKLSVTKK